MSRVIGILWAVLAALPLAAPAASPAPGAAMPVILVFGDSISAGYGIHVEQGWVNLLARKAEQEGYGFRVVNASVSGETTAGGLARLPHVLDVQRPAVLVLELGGNDGLRSLPLESTRENLDRMITLAQQRGIGVLLVGVRLPPNYGERYTVGFQQMYATLARTHRTASVPLLLDGVDLHPELMQGDHIHPNEQGQPLLLANVWPRLVPLLRARHTGGASHG
jgi:acyl-CoA thioesterase-1